jgi:hypothetical protein
VQVIPTFADKSANWVETIQLEGVSYQLGFRWSDRLSSWLATIATTDGEIIRENCALRPNWPLFRSAVDDRMPPGLFLVLRMNDSEEDLTAENLGIDFKVLYVTEAEKTEIREGVLPQYVISIEVL